MNIRPVKTRVFKEGEDLAAFIRAHIHTLPEGSVLAVTSKIVALAQKRTATVQNEKEKALLIRQESEWVRPTKYVYLTLKDGILMANAGVDESNANGKILMLPKHSFRVAAQLRKTLQKYYRITQLGIVITDSRVMPVRAGVVGVALGYAGFKGLRDYRDTPDMFGRTFKFSQTDVADSLATAATLSMGEGSEQQPLCIIERAPVEFAERVRKDELFIPLEDDLYRPLMRGTPRRTKGRKR